MIKKEEHRINEKVRADEVRLVEMEKYPGYKSGIFNLLEALKISKELGYDLIEVSPNANPIVCKIMDYSKFLYEKKKKEKENKKNQKTLSTKEIKLGPNIGEHDFETKIRQSKEFLSAGNKIKAYVQFSGREIIYKSKGEVLLLKFVQCLEEFGIPENMPSLEGKKMHVSMRPKK